MTTNTFGRFSVVYVWAVFVASLAPSAWAGTPAIARFADPRPIIVAHRGCWRITAENSLSGLKACVDHGIDIVEVDLRLTKDGQLVLMHDDTLDRMTNLSGPVAERTLAEFKTARLRRADGGKDSPITNEAPPTFVEELHAAKGNVILYLDIKIPSAQEQIYRTIEQQGAQDWVVIPTDTTGLGKMPDWARRQTILAAMQCGVEGVTTGCYSTLAQAVDADRPFHPLAIGVFFKSDDFPKNGSANASAVGTRLQAWSNAPIYDAGRDEADPSSGGRKVWGALLQLGLDVFGTDDALGLSAYLKTAPRRTAVTWSPECDETRNGKYTFDHLNGSSDHPVRLYLCSDVHCAHKSEFATVTKDTYSAPTRQGSPRPYFLVERQDEGQGTEVRIIGARRLALEGAFNFRDLGGIKTADGRWIRWGQIFRSDGLSKLTPADYSRLNAIGISLVCDLRSRDERKTYPTEWHDGSPVFMLAPVSENSKGSTDDDYDGTSPRPDQSIEDRKAAFERSYVQIAFDSASKFGAVLRAIATSDGPSVFHCAAGRDRTGITAAMLLHILGVPDETIVSDYLLSTKYLEEGERPTPPPATEADAREARALAEVIRLQPRYIESVFKAIDAKYGSFDNYRRDALHFTDADVAELKARLLE
jgi:protein-tyrosine phosphatase